MLSTKRPSHPPSGSFSSKYGAGKATSSRVLRRPIKETSNSNNNISGSGSGISSSRRLERRTRLGTGIGIGNAPDGSSPTPAIVTISVGPEQRLFAAHEGVLFAAPYFATLCREQDHGHEQPHLGSTSMSRSKRIILPDEQPEVLSCVLEYLYKGDYYPRLVHNQRRDMWELEDGQQGTEATIFHKGVGEVILKDTAVYCAATKYGLESLKRLALRKQGLHSGIQCSTILTSARYAYTHTPDTESKLRAHYLALIIRSRETFKRSGTMQMEMEQGGKLFFDLFVALCNYMDDLDVNTTLNAPIVD